MLTKAQSHEKIAYRGNGTGYIESGFDEKGRGCM